MYSLSLILLVAIRIVCSASMKMVMGAVVTATLVVLQVIQHRDSHRKLVDLMLIRKLLRCLLVVLQGTVPF